VSEPLGADLGRSDLVDEDLTVRGIAAKIFPLLQAKMEAADGPLKRLTLGAVILSPDRARGWRRVLWKRRTSATGWM